MKKILNYALAGFMAMSMAVVSCTPTSDETEEPVGDAKGTFVIAAEKGSTATKSITTSDSWIVSKRSTWFSVTPTKGQAGNNDLTVTAEQANEDLKEKIATFTLIDGSTSIPFYVVQRGVVSTILSEEERYVLTGATGLNIPVSGTYAFENIEVSTDASWLEFSQVTTVVEPELLMDSITKSAYAEGTIDFAITEQNDEVGSREAKVTVVAGDQTFEINVIQQSSQTAAADFSKDFYKRSLFFKGTGSWCGNCPPMSHAFSLAQEAYPDRAYSMNLYAQGNQEPSTLYCGNDGVLFLQHFNFAGAYPTGYFNGYAEITLFQDYNFTYDACKNLLKEAIDNYEAEVGIAAVSKIENSSVDLTISFASKVTKSFRYTVAILEDGIVYTQSDYSQPPLVEDPANYEHNHALKGFATKESPQGGQVISLTANETKTETLSFMLPDNVVNPDNVQLQIFVTSEGTYKVEDVLYATYKDWGWIIDNAIQLPVAGFRDFKYEE